MAIDSPIAPKQREHRPLVDKEVLAERAREVRDDVRERYERTCERASALEGRFEERLRERPIASVLTGAAVGFLLGAFLIRR